MIRDFQAATDIRTPEQARADHDSRMAEHRRETRAALGDNCAWCKRPLHERISGVLVEDGIKPNTVLVHKACYEESVRRAHRPMLAVPR